MNLEQQEINRYNNSSQEQLNGEFHWACENGDLELVKALLTSEDLVNHADINSDCDCGFRWACDGGQLNIVKYLLTSPELKKHANLHIYNNEGFIGACEGKHFEVIQFLIFDMDIDKTADITEYLKNNSMEKVENIFKLRELNKQLDNNLSNNNFNQKKVKL